TPTATPLNNTLSLHDALPISERQCVPEERYERPTYPGDDPGSRGAEDVLRDEEEAGPERDGERCQAHEREEVRVEQHPLLAPARSEEHTSELQSRGHLVCRLL